MTGSPAPDPIEHLQRENMLLRRRVARLERELAATIPLITTAKSLILWDFTPYEVRPDDSWIAVDRSSVTELLAALARIDHWNPWRTRIEPRPPQS